jgi:hypothetical protein
MNKMTTFKTINKTKTINVISRNLRSKKIINYDEQNRVLTKRIKLLLEKNFNTIGQENKTKIIIKIFKLIDQYSFLIYDPKNTTYLGFTECIKSKLYEFKDDLKDEFKDDLKDESGYKNLNKLKMLIVKLLSKYYGEDIPEYICCAYKVDNTLCKKIIINKNSKNFCGIHVLNYSKKILKILTKHILVDVAKKCINICFCNT